MKVAGYSYMDIGLHLGVDPVTVGGYLSARKGRARTLKKVRGRCKIYRHIRESLHYHHLDYKTDKFIRLCSRCHGREHSRNRPVKRDNPILNEMAKRLKAERGGQLILSGIMPLTQMQEAEKRVITENYHKAKGNISRTARLLAWSRTKTVGRLKKYKLYDLYPHEPGPFKKDT